MNWNARVLSVLLCTTVGSLAQDEARQPEPWTKWDLASGDWDRNRPLVQYRGATLISTYTSQVWGNVAGGLQRGATYFGVLQFGAVLDFEKMFGWHGASFNTTWLWNAGGSPTTDLTGALFPSSGTESPGGFRALDLWLQQEMFDEALTVRAGLFNADRDFTLSQGAQLFLNSAFGWPILYDGQLGGPPAYPFAAPGLYAAVRPGGGWTFQAAVMQGIVWPPSENPTGFYWRINATNGLLYLGEAQYAWAKAPCPARRSSASCSTRATRTTSVRATACGAARFFTVSSTRCSGANRVRERIPRRASYGSTAPDSPARPTGIRSA